MLLLAQYTHLACAAIALLWGILLQTQSIHAQLRPSSLDSLRYAYYSRAANLSHHDTALFSLAYQIATEYIDINPDSAAHFARYAFTLAHQSKRDDQKAHALYVLGRIYKHQGKFALALKSHLGGQQAAEVSGDSLALLLNINGIGLSYLAQRNYEYARRFFFDLLQRAQRLQHRTLQRMALNNLGYAFWQLRVYDTALSYHTQALAIAQEHRDSLNIGISYINLGVCYQGQRKFAQALDYLHQALALHRRLGNVRNQMLALYYLGWTLHDMHKDAEALPFLLESLAMANSLNMHSTMPEGYKILSETYDALGRRNDAFTALRRYVAIKDSLFSLESAVALTTLQAMYNDARHNEELRILQQQQEQAKRERLFYAIGLILLSALLILSFALNHQATQKNREISRQKDLLEDQAREIELANSQLHETNLRLQELNTAIQQQIAELEVLDTIVQSINTEVSLERLLPILLEQGHLLIPNAERSSILMLDEESGTYRFVAFRGYNPDLFSHLRFSPEETRIRYTNAQPLHEGVYVITEYAFEIEGGAKFTTIPPQCSLVMTIPHSQELDTDLPIAILFFDNYVSNNAFTALDIQRFQRLRKHVITAFAKVRYVEAEHHALLRIAAQNQRLQELNQEKNEFLGIAAHDMKSPLAGIMASTGILKRFFDRLSPEERYRIVNSIEQTAKRMSQIITNLLDINAIESGTFNLSMQALDINALIRTTLEHYHERASAKNIELLFRQHNTHDTEEALAYADAGATSQILDNLLSNAIKYSPHGSSVTVECQAQKEWIRLSIADEGAGIPPEDMKKMFGKFARLSTKPTAGEDSTGLGLSIVKRLTEAMNGRVWCESTVGKGTTFFVELPRYA
ncbi:MAG: ATP-binding protein [Bacteroidota bacterium]|nr:ATP-binding protein [Candidatus Kapabacteria bacterium]MDW8221186.1 ATP-binding protein [Bacteroidota bacterium]